jgi:hypothetical protein
MQIQLANMQPISRSTTQQKQGRTLLASSLSCDLSHQVTTVVRTENAGFEATRWRLDPGHDGDTLLLFKRA